MENNIRKLRIIALLLFLTPALALLGSLLANNYLLSFNFSPDYNYNFKKDLPGNSISYFCNEENNYCNQKTIAGFGEIVKFNKLGQCNKYEIYNENFVKNGDNLKLVDTEDLKNFNFPPSHKKIDQEFYMNYLITNKLNPNCIMSSKSKAYYEWFPIFFETIYKIKKNDKTNLGTSEVVNPFIYGETSISNIVKRYPINYFFKPLLFISVVFMISYWIYYNRVLKIFINSSKNFYFFNFGILSAIFLLLHVFFLGWTFENEFLTKLRRSYVIFFIFFEVLAQAFLIKKIFSFKDKMKNYLYSIVVYLKLLFVLLICFTTVSILTVLMIYDLDPKVDYILEWNYFLVLLFFYFLSFLMWKKLKSNPATS